MEEVVNGGHYFSCNCREYGFLIEFEEDFMSALGYIELHFGNLSFFSS